MNEWFAKAVREAVASTLGWAGIIIATQMIGFCACYWIGHRGITDANRTMNAYLMLPYLWLGFPQMFLAYAVTVLAWYLPLRYDSGKLRIVAPSANFVVWLVVIEYVVEQTANAKFFQY